MDALQIGLVVALVNGVFLLVGKLWADRTLAAERADREVVFEALKSQMSFFRELTLRHFDRRADLYWEALEPFVHLYVINRSRSSTQDENDVFRRASLLASSRLALFAPGTVVQLYTEMLEWTEAAIRNGLVMPGEAEAYAQRFVQAAQRDLVGEPLSAALPGV